MTKKKHLINRFYINSTSVKSQLFSINQIPDTKLTSWVTQVEPLKV